MLTVEQCKKLLPENGHGYTDAEIEQLRNVLYRLAELLLGLATSAEKTNV